MMPFPLTIPQNKTKYINDFDAQIGRFNVSQRHRRPFLYKMALILSPIFLAGCVRPSQAHFVAFIGSLVDRPITSDNLIRKLKQNHFECYSDPHYYMQCAKTVYAGLPTCIERLHMVKNPNPNERTAVVIDPIVCVAS